MDDHISVGAVELRTGEGDGGIELGAGLSSYDVTVADLDECYRLSGERFQSVHERFHTLVGALDNALLEADRALFHLFNKHSKARRIRWEKGDGWYAHRPFVAYWKHCGPCAGWRLFRIKVGRSTANLPKRNIRPEVRDQARELLMQAEQLMDGRRRVTEALRALLVKATFYERVYGEKAASLRRLAAAISADEAGRRREYAEDRESQTLQSLGLNDID